MHVNVLKRCVEREESVNRIVVVGRSSEMDYGSGI